MRWRVEEGGREETGWEEGQDGRGLPGFRSSTADALPPSTAARAV